MLIFNNNKKFITLATLNRYRKNKNGVQNDVRVKYIQYILWQTGFSLNEKNKY